MKILVINAGSSSLKYQLIDMTDESVIAKGTCERIGIDGHMHGTHGEKKYEFDTEFPDHVQAFMKVKEMLVDSEEFAVVDDISEISAIGHRVVQGGDKFNESVLVDESVIETIQQLSDLAPLHNPAHAQGMIASTSVFGKDVPQVAVFDNAFHSTMPPEAYMFPIPYEYYEKYAIRRYGFHGTSHRYISHRCAELMGKDISELKIVTCHLGNGCSIAAVKNGKVIDTSMGLTPLDGFEMGTRCGSIDPSVVIYLQQKEGWTPAETDVVLNKKSGALGISGISSDDRDLRDAIFNDHNERAKLARDIQWYQIRKFIGSYVAAMDGIDALVFAGGIGENTDDLRTDVCKKLSFLGFEIDEEANAAALHGVEKEITTPNSKVKAFVIPTNEELVIARDTRDIVLGMK